MKKQNSNSALIIIDVQNDFMKGGSLEVPNASKILPYINSLRNKFNTIFLTQDYHPEKHVSFAETHKAAPFTTVKLTTQQECLVFPSHCVQGTWGCDFNQDLIRKDSDIIIQKGIVIDCDSFSGFGTAPEQTKLDKLLKEKGIKNLFMVGLCLDYCVRDTAVDGANLGYNVFILKEGTLSLTEKGETETLEQLSKKKIKYISIDDVDKYL